MFTISLDFELYWGVRDVLTLDQSRGSIRGGREAVPRILGLFREFDVHATWAVVGLICCESEGDARRMSPILRPAYRAAGLDPYGELAGTRSEADSDCLYALDLVRLVQGTPHQEIGTHTFSHYYCLEEGASLSAFDADLEAMVRTTRRKLGLAPGSIVFPRNQVSEPYLQRCAVHDLHAYRGNQSCWMYRASSGRESKVKRLARLLDAYVNLSGHNGNTPSEEPVHRLVNVPASRFLRPWNQRLRWLEPLRKRRVLREMTCAAERGLSYHLWWHPENFGTHTDQNLSVLREILMHYRELHATYGMRSLHMGEVATQLKAASLSWLQEREAEG